MLWFKKRKKEESDRCNREAVINLEVEAHRQKRERVAAETQKAAGRFVGQVKDNGFTLKIYSAAGGKR